MQATTYYKGDLAKYTGNTQTIHGGLFYELVYLEGHNIGKSVVTQRSPDGVDLGQSSPSKLKGIQTPQIGGA